MAEHGTDLAPRQRVFTGRTSGDEEAALVNENHEHTQISEKPQHPHHHHLNVPDPEGMYRFWRRFTRKGKKNIGVKQSLRAFISSSWLNLFLIFTPIAWVSHWAMKDDWSHGKKWPPQLTFVLCFVAIVPHERLFDYGGEQMSFYIGKSLGDFLSITLNNVVEATLAIILLIKCDLRLLQSTIVGVVILHLLLIPGTAFITGGARIVEQELHPHLVQLNHSLLTIGVMALLIPAAFFAALDRGVGSTITTDVTVQSIVNDDIRGSILQMSRGLAIILLLVYIASRIFLHNPPGEDNALRIRPDAPEALKHEERKFFEEEPQVNQYVCIIVLLLSIAIMAATVEWLVESIEFVREAGGITEEWFGLILLPLVSFAADGFVAIVYFGRSLIHHLRGQSAPPGVLAKARAIDLSIQFTLFWMPFLILLGWWTHKPMHLLFDFFEVAILLGTCFIVNYVTADAKTNWVEGYAMVSFYIMIALCSWFYPGQPEIALMSTCESVLDAIAIAASGATETH